MEEWMKDERLKEIPAEKLEFLSRMQAIRQSAGSSRKELMQGMLPLIRKPLLKRMDLDDLIIFDKRHLLMLGRKGESEMLSDIRRISLTMPDTGEEAYDVLWPAVREGKLEIRFAGGAIPGRRRDYDPLWSTAC